MESLPTFFTQNNLNLILGALGFLLLWLLVLSFFLWRSLKLHGLLTSGAALSNLEALLSRHLKTQNEQAEVLKILQRELDLLKSESQTHFQRVGLLRFNPFKDTGGNQSFALALLNDVGDGIVISSLHQRDQTRVYGKPVKNGQAIGHALSEEEKEAIRLALAQ